MAKGKKEIDLAELEHAEDNWYWLHSVPAGFSGKRCGESVGEEIGFNSQSNGILCGKRACKKSEAFENEECPPLCIKHLRKEIAENYTVIRGRKKAKSAAAGGK
jgi:hypothetical protein